MAQKVGTVMYLGAQRDIWMDEKQWKPLSYTRGTFSVNSQLGADFTKLGEYFDEFCKQELNKIIDKGIRKLRSKKVKVTLDYTDGTKTFPKDVELSVNDFLEQTGFSQQLDWEIGKYEREWGINAIDTNKKLFTLYFNLNLIKYDSGPHIDHVVAHELTHVFHRDHGPRFQSTLRELDPSTNWSLSFFNGGISNVGKSTAWMWYVIAAGALFLLIVLGWTILSPMISNIGQPQTPNTF